MPKSRKPRKKTLASISKEATLPTAKPGKLQSAKDLIKTQGKGAKPASQRQRITNLRIPAQKGR